MPPKRRKKEIKKHNELDDLGMMVPQLSANTKAIQLLKYSKAVKNLGLYTQPDGCGDRHMLQIRDRMEDWTKRVKTRALLMHSVWTIYTHNLWSGLRYGLEASLTMIN